MSSVMFLSRSTASWNLYVNLTMAGMILRGSEPSPFTFLLPFSDVLCLTSNWNQVRTSENQLNSCASVHEQVTGHASDVVRTKKWHTRYIGVYH